MLKKFILPPYLRFLAKRTATRNQGRYHLHGITRPVEVIRDTWGVPHIYAENREDLFFAQGFVHVQDRLWQMELTRRIAQGRICEIFGKDALPADRITRTLGFRRCGEQDWAALSSDSMAPFLQAYVKGINAGIELKGQKLPLEFGLLKHRPDPWTPADVLTFGRFISFQMCFGWLHEVVRMQTAAAVGTDRLEELSLDYPGRNPVILEHPGEAHRLTPDGRLEAFAGPWLNPIGGSNNWTVSGAKMEHGAATLANDPHLVLSAPNIWYENHLVCPDYEATGVTLPGAPMVMIGHNRHIAWGATLSFADVQDTYIEEFTDQSLTHYRFKGETKAAKILEEKIFIQGQTEPHIEKVVITHHGPVVSGIVDCPEKQLSLRSKALEPNQMMKAFYLLNLAENWDDFVGGVRLMAAPSLNLVYADTSGNIGYYMTGEVPLCPNNKSLLPMPGWTGANEWQGNVPFEEMPHAFNPAKGYIFTCNNKVTGDDYPHFLGRNFMNGFRAKRLQQLFENKEKYSLQDFQRWQMDVFCVPGRELAEHFARAADKGLLAQLSEGARDAVKRLVDWDGYLGTESVGGCIYSVIRRNLFDGLIGSALDERLTYNLRGEGPFPIGLKFTDFMDAEPTIVLNLLDNPESWWVQRAGGLHTAMAQAVEKSVAYLRETLGHDPQQWHWGRLHTITFGHAFGVKPHLAGIFNRGPFPIPGDTNTLNQARPAARGPYGGEVTAASWRQIIDMGDFSRSTCVMPIGQSGSIASPHYDDQAEMWLKGQYRPMLWTRADVETNASKKLRLEP